MLEPVTISTDTVDSVVNRDTVRIVPTGSVTDLEALLAVIANNPIRWQPYGRGAGTFAAKKDGQED